LTPHPFCSKIAWLPDIDNVLILFERNQGRML
jgi:hypothetical protein